MSLLSFLYWLLTGSRQIPRQSTDGALREFTHGKFGEEFFDAAALRCGLLPVRSKILKDRRR